MLEINNGQDSVDICPNGIYSLKGERGKKNVTIWDLLSKTSDAKTDSSVVKGGM